MHLWSRFLSEKEQSKYDKITLQPPYIPVSGSRGFCTQMEEGEPGPNLHSDPSSAALGQHLWTPVCVTQHRVFLALPSPLPREFCCVRMNQQIFPSFAGWEDRRRGLCVLGWGPVVSLSLHLAVSQYLCPEMPSCKAGRWLVPDDVILEPVSTAGTTQDEGQGSPSLPTVSPVPPT